MNHPSDPNQAYSQIDLERRRRLIVVGLLILLLAAVIMVYPFASAVWTQYDQWRTEVLPTQEYIRAEGLEQILTFDDGYKAVVCEQRGRHSCQWICEELATGILRECEPTRSYPTAIRDFGE